MNMRFRNHAVFPHFLFNLAIFINSKTGVTASLALERDIPGFANFMALNWETMLGGFSIGRNFDGPRSAFNSTTLPC